MRLSRFEYGEVIGYEIKDKNKMIIYFKCIKCNEIVIKEVYLDRVSTIVCDNCKYKFIFVPTVFNKDRGDIIEYAIINYGYYRKLLEGLVIDKDISLEEKRNKIYKYVVGKLIC